MRAEPAFLCGACRELPTAHWRLIAQVGAVARASLDD
jgi:hypothetical protein